MSALVTCSSGIGMNAESCIYATDFVNKEKAKSAGTFYTAICGLVIMGTYSYYYLLKIRLVNIYSFDKVIMINSIIGIIAIVFICKSNLSGFEKQNIPAEA